MSITSHLAPLLDWRATNSSRLPGKTDSDWKSNRRLNELCLKSQWPFPECSFEPIRYVVLMLARRP